MPRRGGGRVGRQVVDEQRVSDSEEDVAQPIVPLRHRARQTEVEVEHLTRPDNMELVLARFERMNPPNFNGAEGGLAAEGCLEHMSGLFDRVQ
ncbi:hypothetical protein F511_29440 [Dorcoceras hygrometricum]|uniref:Uncharacterized protein n=1 Tax=Dorcoceras hygrometricum TaxID=472368 RepID=A0A2Z7AH48_9LAMI|nr:hypothetical protein F511_29440 [Dorcoceras hygrometricum]